MSSTAKPLGTRTRARGVLLNFRAHARRNVFAVVLALLALTALSATPVVAVAPSVQLAAAGARLAYATGTEKEPSQYVWIAQANGREPQRLGPGVEPLLAPNGLSVATALFGDGAPTEKGPAIGIYSALGGPATSYLNLETATATPLAWSPDSRYLVVSLQSTAVTNIAAGSDFPGFQACAGLKDLTREEQLGVIADFVKDYPKEEQGKIREQLEAVGGEKEP